MILAWMLYSLIVAALLGAAALAAQRAARLADVPTRWIWIGSLTGSVAFPLVARIGRAPGSPADIAFAPSGGEPAGGGSVGIALERWWQAASVPAGLEIPLLVAWVAASLLVLTVLATAYIRLHGEVRRWRRQRIEDVEVRVSEDRGPAVVGFARIEVVLPRWVLACTATERRLILMHEMEHRRAGDSRLLVAALATAVLMPWNPLVWWQLRRLRLATEMDCDRRVLQKGADVRAYASLLLNAKLDGLGTRLLTATLFRSKSELGRRIETMTARKPSHRAMRAVAAAVVGGGVLFAACETPTPSAPDAQATAAAKADPASAAAFGVLTEAEQKAAFEKLHQEIATYPDRAGELKAAFHDEHGNVFISEDGTWTHLDGDQDGDVPREIREWTTEDGDVQLFQLRETETQAARTLKEIKEGKLTKEFYFREQAESDAGAGWVSDESGDNVKFGPTD